MGMYLRGMIYRSLIRSLSVDAAVWKVIKNRPYYGKVIINKIIKPWSRLSTVRG